MKKVLPPIIAILFTIAFDKAIDLVFNLGPYDNSETPGTIFLIEAIMIFVFILIGFLIHWFLIVRIIENGYKNIYLKIFGWGLTSIIILCIFYILIIYKDSKFLPVTKILLGLRLFFILAIFLLVDIYSFKIIKKYFSSHH